MFFKRNGSTSETCQMFNILEKSKIWPSLWTSEQATEFQTKNSWFACKDGKLGCSVCIKAKHAIQFEKSNSDGKVRISPEWVDYEIIAAESNRKNQLASLRTKIKQHSESKSHIIAESIMNKGEEKVLDKMFEHASEKVMETNVRLFNTVYCIAKNHRPFLQFEELVDLQQING
ncbi:hypothetical protein RN001_016386 [Aquatica leii]|uniref:Uncharacterized protein n=1 Tax=Aquatica leii TaxID=1421715 RepID=A0AAN7NXM6_9COLE|nr:hypothetical protein RN001_016386 [Aquatica leii]